MMGCLFFLFCLATYESSTTRIGILDGLGMRQIDPNDFEKYIYPYKDYADEYRTAEEAIVERGPSVYAWVPAYDNYDGSEVFWRHYELSLLSSEEKQQMY